MFLSQPVTRLLAASCAFSCTALLLSGGTAAHAQAADPSNTPIDYLYVSAQGSDSWTGQAPVPADGGSGPFQTLAHAQETLGALSGSGLTQPVEIAVDPAVCPVQDFLGRWFPAVPTTPVIWHADTSRTVLIYTPAMSQQIDALASEDYANASGPKITRFYVSSAGDDTWRGLSPAPDADNGPFRTLDHAQEAVAALLADSPGAPVEVVFETDMPVYVSGKPKVTPKITATDAAKPSTAAKHLGSGSAGTITFKIAHKGGPITIKGGPAPKPSAGPKLVFAHYMVCNRNYGGSVAGYERDIREAQAAGINGFALNCGSWNGGNYKGDVASMFQAAEAVSPDGSFKLFFSADMTGLSYPEVVQMMTAYASRPNYWNITQMAGTTPVNRPVLSTWGGEGGEFAAVKSRWQRGVLQPLKAAGINTYFMPFFFTTSPDGRQYITATPASASAEVSGEIAGLADGMFYASSVMCPLDPSRTTLIGAESYAASLKAAGLGTMGSVSPQYWGNKQLSSGRRYFEYDGGEGLTAQWASIINVQKPDWVECFTWNDFDEATYFSPIDDVNKYWPYAAHTAPGYYKSHAGALKLNQYYINWYKTGSKPLVTSDSLYCFYRTHPKNAVATNEHIGTVSWFTGDCLDDIFVTTILTAPATLVVTTGSQIVTLPVPAGLQNTRVPFQTGTQSFQVIRAGRTVLTQSGEAIVAAPAEYNFNYYTAAASN